MRATMRWLLAATACVLAGSASAQSYPNRPIRFIVPWTPAGTVDIVGRQLAERLSARLGQPVVVENRAGATGQIGSQAVVQAPPDGYTLLVMSATVHSFSPNLAKNFPFDPVDDFTPISQIVSFPYVMVVAASSPHRTVADLADAARKNPGKVSYGSFGVGSGPYLVSELFALRTGTQLLHVPYKGAAQALTDLAGGQIVFFIDSLPSPLPQIRGGKLRALSVTTPARSTHLPDVPTMAETVPGFEAIAWLGIAGPAKMPRELTLRLNEEIQRIAVEPEYVARLRNAGLDSVASASPEAFREFLLAQKRYWGEFVRDAKIPLAD
jgi:tripartite-type tricarboxylate transporter receptor subunit TctC